MLWNQQAHYSCWSKDGYMNLTTGIIEKQDGKFWKPDAMLECISLTCMYNSSSLMPWACPDHFSMFHASWALPPRPFPSKRIPAVPGQCPLEPSECPWEPSWPHLVSSGRVLAAVLLSHWMFKIVDASTCAKLGLGEGQDSLWVTGASASL